MITANQKSTIDKHTHTHKSNPDTVLKISSNHERTKEEGNNKDLQKQIQNPKQFTGWQ